VVRPAAPAGGPVRADDGYACEVADGTAVARGMRPGWHHGVRLSISLSEADVAALDEHVRAAGLPSRSAAVQRAIRLLTRGQLEQDYAAAWREWDDSGDREVWEGVVADGLR
jgi:Arc/MetJ-type ribon-helix-helix transcriptional regulator